MHDVEGDTGTPNSVLTAHRSHLPLTSVVVKVWRTELGLVGEEGLVPWGLYRDMGFLVPIHRGVISSHVDDRSLQCPLQTQTKHTQLRKQTRIQVSSDWIRFVFQSNSFLQPARLSRVPICSARTALRQHYSEIHNTTPTIC